VRFRRLVGNTIGCLCSHLALTKSSSATLQVCAIPFDSNNQTERYRLAHRDWLDSSTHVGMLLRRRSYSATRHSQRPFWIRARGLAWNTPSVGYIDALCIHQRLREWGVADYRSRRSHYPRYRFLWYPGTSGVPYTHPQFCSGHLYNLSQQGSMGHTSTSFLRRSARKCAGFHRNRLCCTRKSMFGYTAILLICVDV
jgi:hypothetical protein